MRHFVLLVLGLVGAYVSWHYTPARQKRTAARVFREHRAPIGTLIFIAFLLLCAAVYLPSTSFF